MAKARLIITPTEPIVYTAAHEFDARTAIIQGLADYIEGLSFDAQGGRHVAIRRTFASWAEPEDEARYPAAYISSPGEGSYDASRLTPSVDHTERLAQPDGRYVVHVSEFVAALALEVWANDPKERMYLAMMLEDSLCPLDYRYGLLLELPYFYGLRASYEPTSSRYQDSSEDSMKRYRVVTFSLTASVPMVRLRAYADGRARAIVTAGENVVLSTDDC